MFRVENYTEPLKELKPRWLKGYVITHADYFKKRNYLCLSALIHQGETYEIEI